MSAQVANNAWGTIVHHQGQDTLELVWSPATATMSDGGFKATLALFAWQTEKLRPSFLLIDATQFQHKSAPGVMQWRDDFIIPRYGGAGGREMCLHVSARLTHAMEW